jgi:hypothetical protein
VGQSCADSLDCCGGIPCVPDTNGNLICCPNCVPSDAGGKPCVPVTGGCTTNADCCNGGYCNVPAGSIQGTCNPIPIVPPPPDSGTPLPDGSSTPDTSTGGGGGGSCSLYGQGCATASDCCNSVPCTQADGLTACSGQSGCSCVFPLH